MNQTTEPAPDPIALSTLPDRVTDPTALGPLAVARRAARSGEAIEIRSAPATDKSAPATIVRGQTVHPLSAWPNAAQCRPGDRLVLRVPATAADRTEYVRWLSETVLPDGVTIAPWSPDDGALHILWCIAATRLAAASAVGVEARHDLIGIRLAQLALGMGADALTGPIDADRHLPLAGVPRPTEHTREGLTALIVHAGLTPVVHGEHERDRTAPSDRTASDRSPSDRPTA